MKTACCFAKTISNVKNNVLITFLWMMANLIVTFVALCFTTYSGLMTDKYRFFQSSVVAAVSMTDSLEAESIIDFAIPAP